MWNEKANIIDKQTAQLAERDAELAKLRPFAGPAEEMLTVHTRLSAMAGTNPAELPTDVYTAAVDTVKARYRAGIVQTTADTLQAERGAAIRAEVLGQEGPQIVAGETERFTRDEEPELRKSIQRTAEQSLIAETRQRLRADRPSEIENEFRATMGPEIIAREIARFTRDEEPQLRADNERTAPQRVTKEQRDRLRTKVKDEADIRALALAETEERFRARVETIAGNAKRTRRVPLANLHHGDVITIELAEAFADDQELNSHDVTKGRVLRVTIDDPAAGTAYVTGDSWEKGGPLNRMHAFRGGSHLEIGSALDTPQGEKSTEQQSGLAASLTYSVPLRTIHNGNDTTLPVFDVKKVAIDTVHGRYTLLDRAGIQQKPYDQK